MKKVLLFALAFSMLGFNGFAQDEEPADPFEGSERKPQKGFLGAGMDISGLATIALGNFRTPVGASISPSGDQYLFLKYYLSNDLVARLGFGIATNSSKNTLADSSDGLQAAAALWTKLKNDQNTKTSQFALTFSPGIEKHFGGSDKLDPYVGGQINLTILGAQKTTSNQVVTGDDGVLATTSSVTEDITTTVAGGMGFGISALAGFQYFFAKHIALGAEIMWGFNTLTSGGETTTDLTNTVVDNTGTTTVTTNTVSTNKTSTSGLSAGTLTAGGNLTLTFFFNK